MPVIFIIEDNAPLRENTKTLLELNGYQVSVFDSGPPALEQLKEGGADLVLCDIILPGMTGGDVLGHVRKMPSGGEVPFIFLSALAEKDQVRDGMNLGADDYVTKPFTSDCLLSAVKSRLERSKKRRWRMEAILEGTQTGTWEWNVQTGETVFSAMWAQIVGYTLEELAPISIKTWESLAHPEDLKESGLALQRHFSGEQPFYDFECRIKHKDGHWVWIHDRGRVATRTEDGAPLMMFGTHVDVSYRKWAEQSQSESIENAERNIADLRWRLSTSELDEMRRIASGLHDHSVQDLVAIQLNLSRAIGILGGEHPAVRDIMSDCAALAENNACTLRSLAYELHVPWIQHGDFLSGIQEYACRFSERTGVSVSFEAPPAIPRLDAMKEIALYRVLQESLMNVHRHSSSKQARISISVAEDKLLLTIHDEGRPSGTTGLLEGTGFGVGILSMQERMTGIGGRLDVSHGPEGHSTVAVLPLTDQNDLKN
ncbi:MAG: response regulator [Terrimicrobiaceae bacterium]